MPAMTVTLQDIAARASVSKTTVSMVLGNKRTPISISEGTRHRIQELAKEMGWEPNLAARALAKGKTLMVGLIVSRADRPMYWWVIEGIENALESQDYRLVLCISDADIQRESAHLSVLARKQVDGIIITPTHHTLLPPPALQNYLRMGRPVVSCCRRWREPIGPAVVVNDELGGYLATKHLLDLGHRKIAYVHTCRLDTLDANVHQLSEEEELRAAGFRRALGEAGIEPVPSHFFKCNGHPPVDSGIEAGMNIARLPDRPTALFVPDDRQAVGVIKGLTRAGLRVPQDISVVGHDDAYGELTTPRLTTIRQPGRQLGETAAHIVLQMIAGQSASDVYLKPELVIGESTTHMKH